MTTVAFGQWIRQRRKALDLTREALAQHVGCSTSAIEKIETGQRQPSRQLAERLADALRLDPTERSDFLRAARPATATSILPPSNLPLQPTSFVGREHESAAIRALLRQDTVRLLTLTGTGGVGKTRLALHVAADLLSEFRHGIWFVPLASLHDPALVITTIAHVLGIRETGNQALTTQVTQYLQDKHMLLVLDNLEHLLEVAPQLGMVLAAAPQLKLLITSRVALGLTAEHEFLVVPLPLPPLRQLSIPVLSQYAAIALFIQRALTSTPTFSLTKDTAADIVAICIQLDGLPLAIELVAARTRLLSLPVIRAWVANQRDRVASGSRDRPDRHRSLHAMIAWSVDGLEAFEQRLFTCLGIFAGGATLEAIEAVCVGRSSESVHAELSAGSTVPSTLLAALESLLDHHLLVCSQGAHGAPRFMMLETIREYALAQLATGDEELDVQQRHAEYYLALAEQAEAALTGPDQHIWLDRLADDHDNLRIALHCVINRRQGEQAARLSSALWRFWMIRGYLSEGRAWLSATCALNGIPIVARATLLNRASGLSAQQGDYTHAHSLLEESLALWRELGHTEGIAHALNNLGTIAMDQGKYEEARPWFEGSLALWRALGQIEATAPALGNLGYVAMEQGDATTARALLTESLAIYQRSGNIWGTAQVLSNLGRAALLREDAIEARALLAESLTLWRALRDQQGIASCLEEWAQVMLHDRPIEAVRLCGAAQTLRDALDMTRRYYDEARFAHTIAKAQLVLDSATFTAAWNSGIQFTPEQAIDYVLESEDAVGRRHAVANERPLQMPHYG